MARQMKERKQAELELRVLRAKQAGLSERLGKIQRAIDNLEKRLAELNTNGGGIGGE